MITIREDSHFKIGGINSLFLTITPIPEIISIIKSSGVYNYNAKTKEWEVPISSLAYLLDNLTYLDDIQLVLKNHEEKIENVELKIVPVVTPFPHQVEAVKYGLKNDRWLLLDSPGLGKSLSMIMLAEELQAQRDLKHCLIICGINTLKTNWEKEIEKHSHFSSVVIGKKINSKGRVTYTSIKERANQLREPINDFFIIINIESLRDVQVVDAIINSSNQIDMMIFDECHKAKGWSSIQGTNLLKLQSHFMVAATGTLIMNNPLDAYVPLAWIGKERKNNITNFKKTYCVFDTITRGRIIGFKNLDLLKNEIEECALRRTKDILENELPPKTIINEYVDMSDSHRKFYSDVSKGIKESCDLVNLNKNNMLSMITRLRQASSCPQVLTTDSVMSSKIERAVELVKEIVSQCDKVVIMSMFKEPVYQLQELLRDYSPLVGTGDTSDAELFNNTEKFQTDSKYKIFICTSQRCGTGITLTSARYMILLDLPWTSALLQQCEDRIHRIGSDVSKPVFIYRLICAGTFDEVVLRKVEMKKAVSDFIIDDEYDAHSMEILKNYIQNL